MCAILADPGATQRELMRRLVAAGEHIDRRVLHIQLQRLTEYGLIEGERQETGTGRPWHYRPRVTREELIQRTLGEVFDFLPLDASDRDLVLDLFDARFEDEELPKASSG